MIYNGGGGKRRPPRREKPLFQNLRAFHGSDDGLEWRIAKLVHERGALFWLRLLTADFFAKFARMADDLRAGVEMDRIVPLVSRERLVTSTQGQWARIASVLERRSTVATTVGKLRSHGTCAHVRLL